MKYERQMLLAFTLYTQKPMNNAELEEAAPIEQIIHKVYKTLQRCAHLMDYATHKR